MNRLATVSAIDDKRAHALFGDRRADLERKFAAALRHSRRVRLLRVGVPGAVVGAVALLMLVNYLNPLRLLNLPGRVGHLVVSGTKITMEAPRLAGFTRDARAYEMTARSAAQEITNPDKMELQGVKAKFETPDRAMINVTADTGLYDSKKDLLKLKRNVVITSTNGYDVLMSEADIDIHTSHVVSDKPLVVKMMNGTINANHVEVLESGDTVRFSGGVTMTVNNPPPPHAEVSAEEQ